MTLKDKIHNKLQEKALNKALLETIGDIGDDYICEDELQITIQKDKLENFNELNFVFPSWNKIEKLAKKYYKKFNLPNVKKIMYGFDFLHLDKDLIVDAEGSNVYIGSNTCSNIKILGADKVEIFGSPIEYNGTHNGGIDIHAKNIEIFNFRDAVYGDINLISEFLELNNTTLVMTKDINIKSKFLEFNNADITSKNMYLTSSLIVCENSKLKARERIIINNPNCDEIKEVDAPSIRYNGQDITYSESIVMPKLRNNLIDVLKKLRNRVYANIVVKVNEESERYKKELNNTPSIKILKK